MSNAHFLDMLMELDYNFTITTADISSKKIVTTKYGVYYLDSFTESSMMRCLVKLKADELNYVFLGNQK